MRSHESYLEAVLNIHGLGLGDVILSKIWSFMDLESKLTFSVINKRVRRKLMDEKIDLGCFMPSKDLILGYKEQSTILSLELEKNSYDEFDDFKSRHPAPKEKKNHHKRGDSLFNSDIEQIAEMARREEFGNMNMLASLACVPENLESLPSFLKQKRISNVLP